MQKGYITPSFRADTFSCPHCNAVAQQKWLTFKDFNDWAGFQNKIKAQGAGGSSFYDGGQLSVETTQQDIVEFVLSEDSFKRAALTGAQCQIPSCKKYSYWLDGKMIYPLICAAPIPNKDMPEDCKKLYLEAREIADKSPRGAAALLRLCVQMLMPELGEKGKNINDDIASLVRKNKIPPEIQKALDYCRVIGNNAVHPGTIALEEKPEAVSALFTVLNMIVKKTLTAQKEIDSLYSSLPEEARAAITKRDS